MVNVHIHHYDNAANYLYVRWFADVIKGRKYKMPFSSSLSNIRGDVSLAMSQIESISKRLVARGKHPEKARVPTIWPQRLAKLPIYRYAKRRDCNITTLVPTQSAISGASRNTPDLKAFRNTELKMLLGRSE